MATSTHIIRPSISSGTHRIESFRQVSSSCLQSLAITHDISSSHNPRNLQHVNGTSSIRLKAIFDPKKGGYHESTLFGRTVRTPSSTLCSHPRKGTGLVIRAADMANEQQPWDSSQGSQNVTGIDPRQQAAGEKLVKMASYFRRLGSLGFWSQLICSVVSAVILAFSIVITGQATSPVTLYLTSGGIVAAFLSVFWSFEHTRLSNELRRWKDDPKKAPSRKKVAQRLKNGLYINLLGMGATLLGMQATVGVLVARALTSSYPAVVQSASPGYSPVMALDVFLVQASANTLLSHFFGIIFNLELLRSVTVETPSDPNPRNSPKLA